MSAPTAHQIAQNAIAVQQLADDNILKPDSAPVSVLDTSNWPLLLKNCKLLCFPFCMAGSLTVRCSDSNLLTRTGHYTPIPSGSSPLKRDLKSYIKSVLLLLLHVRYVAERDAVTEPA